MKLAINLPLAVFWQSMGEAFAPCSHLGKDTQWLVELFAGSSQRFGVAAMADDELSSAAAYQVGDLEQARCETHGASKSTGSLILHFARSRNGSDRAFWLYITRPRVRDCAGPIKRPVHLVDAGPH